MTKMRGFQTTFIIILAVLASALDIGASEQDIFFTDDIIDSIIIDNREIYDTDSSKYDHWIFKLANTLHIKTRKFVIRREILLDKNGRWSPVLARETERNLRNLKYIWDAEIKLDTSATGKKIMKLTTQDSWTISGGVTYVRSSNESSIQLSFEDANLFGLGQYLSMGYVFRDYDENFADFSFREPRLLGSRNYLHLFYNGNPEIGLTGFYFGRPFYSLRAKYAFDYSFAHIDQRNDFYTDGLLTSRYVRKGTITELNFARRFGSYHQKITPQINLKYFDIEINNREIRQGFHFNFPFDSNYFSIEPVLNISHLEYIKLSKINFFGHPEDFLLSKGVGISTGWDIDADNGRNQYQKVSIEAHFDAQFGNNLILIPVYIKRWFKDNQDFRKYNEISIRYYNNHKKWLTHAVRALYLEDIRKDGNEVIYLGENRGIRGYPRNYLTGEKGFIVNIENRFFTGVEILTALFGVTQFIDFGQTWSKNEKFDFDNNIWAVGIGLRIGAQRVSSLNVFRMDLAYAGKIKDWQLSIGLGQYF